ncbi:competence/damage-inducible protein cinA [Colwellia chukchiensis]|uniref:CinA-like protein n=1 Tax=Colwellia chukchiensis TaxID=641665 RepID=A0A1H7S886_9GAMM|nr:CinA family nicotinamide mononucleotide deamidase-related protein [Colwellia chukchiensis]SEL67954.1 competence/damage-inducible protein cinA [Colwellia chukchiensis]
MKINVSLLLTGDELMNGDIIDTNSLMIATSLSNIGLKVNKKVTLGDDITLLNTEIKQLSQSSDLLIINGGLGPTVDDLTSQALADAGGVKLQLNTQAHSHLKQWAKRRNITLNEPNLKQAYLPSGCDIIANKNGSAVGFSMTLNNCLVICTPGVPSELKTMLSDEIVPNLVNVFRSSAEHPICRLQTFGIGESNLQALIDQQIPDWPAEIAIGFRAAMPILEVKLCPQNKTGEHLLTVYQAKLCQLLGDHVLAVGASDKITLAEYLVPLLLKSKQKITVAESCTGGLIASQITAIAGSSAVFEAGFVTYSNQMKSKMLGVAATTLQRHGAVSEATVLAMARGALERSSADFAIAVSGIAGPSGASKNKPLGSVWVAWGNKESLQARYYCLPMARQDFQQAVAARSLDLIRRLIIESKELANYNRVN